MTTLIKTRAIENDAATEVKVADASLTGADIQDSAVTGATGRHGFRTAIPCKHS